MEQYETAKKTILLASARSRDLDYIESRLHNAEYRIIRAENFLSLINSIFRYHVHMLISDVELPDISMTAFLPFLRERYHDIKVIIIMKTHFPELELALRKHNILYLMHWPLNGDLLASIVDKGLKKYEKGLISA